MAAAQTFAAASRGLNFPASGALSRFRRIRLDTNGRWAYAGAADTDALATATRDVFTLGDMLAGFPLVNGEYTIQLMIANGAITAQTAVYAAANGKVSSSGTVLVGLALSATTTDGDQVAVVPSAAGIIGAVARTGLSADTQPYGIPLTGAMVTGTGALLGTAAGTPAGAFGLTVGTFGTNTPKLVGEAASGNSKTDAARFLAYVPAEYVAAGNITCRVSARITGNVQVAQTIAAAAYKGDSAAGLGASLIATAAQTLTAAFANYDFVITGTTLNPGDPLDIQLTGVANDTGGTANKLIEIGDLRLIMSVKG